MGFGFGPGAEMMKDYKSNLRRKSKSEKNKSITGESKNAIKRKNVSKEELYEFKQKFLEQKRKDTIRNTAVFIAIGLTVIFVFGLVLFS